MALKARGPRFSNISSLLHQLPWRRQSWIDSHTLILMLKGALPPTIVIAIHQSDAIADITLTAGYLSALISVLSQSLMPRTKFLKIMLFDLLAICVSASLCCLALFCAVKAREHNTPSDASESVKNGYNSDACAVSAIWLIFMIWGSKSIRAWKPMELQDPVVAFSVFASVTVTRAGMFVTLSEGLEFVSRLLKGFMLGFAVAIGVSLFVYPVTSRGHVFEDFRKYAQRIDEVLQSQLDFVIEYPVAWCRRLDSDLAPPDVELKKNRLQAAMVQLDTLHGKLHTDLFYAEDEVAWGKLSAAEVGHICGLLRNVLLPLSGISMHPDILEMVMQREEPDIQDDDSPADPKEQAPGQAQMEQVRDMLHDRLTDCAGLVSAGLGYALLNMELVKPPKDIRDEETGSIRLDAMNPEFTSHFQQRLRDYHSQRTNLSQVLASLERFSPEKTSPEPADMQKTVPSELEIEREWFVVLYMLQLQDSILKATLDMIEFANGKLSFRGSEHDKGSHQEDPASGTSNNEATKYPDPEHLPPANSWEKASTRFRLASRLIRSEESMFGFRVSAAAFCVGILAYLHQTQDFFIRQRCIWAMIVIEIGMSPTSGQTLLGFVTRILVTVASLALALMVWYIPDQKTAGVIVFLYLANVFEYYFYITKPQIFGPSVISIVTLNVIVGYELQIRKLGLEVGTSNGQPYYPIYLFGPYKLAAVAAGCTISFFWVIFPHPVTSKSTLRRGLGRGLFNLAKFYSCMHTTIKLRLSGELHTGNAQASHRDSPAIPTNLATTRQKIFKDEMILLNQLRTLSHFTTFEPPIGGKFSKDIYDCVIAQVQRILISMALMAHTAQNLETPQPKIDASNNNNRPNQDSHDANWVSRLASIALQSEDFNSHSITSLLCHLGSSITNAQPLPPYLSVGDSFSLACRLQQVGEISFEFRVTTARGGLEMRPLMGDRDT
ncbi:MFS transporter [Aspergillus crustosus]